LKFNSKCEVLNNMTENIRTVITENENKIKIRWHEKLCTSKNTIVKAPPKIKLETQVTEDLTNCTAKLKLHEL